MSLHEGRLIGFLGPNGAGKTTLIRILMGLLSSTSGSAEIFGQPVNRFGKSIRREIGYLPGDVHFYPNMKASSLLAFFAKARRIDCMEEALRIASALDLDLSRTIRKFSTGMRQKLGLIQALMHRPRLLILDEPTSALDPLVRNIVVEELRRVTCEGRTVLFSSHSLDEVEALCDEVIILRDGRIVEHQPIETLRHKALRRIHVVFAESASELTHPPAELTVMKTEGNVLDGTWSGTPGGLVDWLSQLELEDVIIEKPDLNDLFMSYYTRSATRSERQR